jgi:hypothetical protein
MEAYELLIPEKKKSGQKKNGNTEILPQIAELVSAPKNTLKKWLPPLHPAFRWQRQESGPGHRYGRGRNP